MNCEQNGRGSGNRAPLCWILCAVAIVGGWFATPHMTRRTYVYPYLMGCGANGVRIAHGASGEYGKDTHTADPYGQQVYWPDGTLYTFHKW